MSERAFKYFNNLRLIQEPAPDRKGATFVIEPLPKGYGVTVGNALRRILLSSIEGYAISEVQIEGVDHEFQAIDGVLEDVSELKFNLKKIKVRLLDESLDSHTIKLTTNGETEVYATAFHPDPEVEIIDPDERYICTLTSKHSKLSLEATVAKGVGFLEVPESSRTESKIGVMHVEANYSPVEKVSYSVEDTRVGVETNLDKLIITVETNGTKAPEAVILEASTILQKYFTWLAGSLKAEYVAPTVEVPVAEHEDEILDQPINVLEFSPRTENTLRRGGIEKVRALLQFSLESLRKIERVGDTTLGEIVNKLAKRGLYLSEEG